MDWAAWRAEFPILTRKTSADSCSLGALSRRAEARRGIIVGRRPGHVRVSPNSHDMEEEVERAVETLVRWRRA